MKIDTISGWVSTAEEMDASEFERLVRNLAKIITNNNEGIHKASLSPNSIYSAKSGKIKHTERVLIQFAGSQVLTYEFFKQLEEYLEECIKRSDGKGKIKHPREMALYEITSPAFEHLQRWDLLAHREYDGGTIYFQIPGLPTEQAVSKLSKFGDELIVPEPDDGKGGRLWMAFNEKKQTIYLDKKPGVLLVRYIDGEFTHHNENEVARTFEQIKKIALDERLLRNFMESKEGENLRDRADRGGIDIDYELKMCTFYNPGWSTPHVDITQFIKGKDDNLRLNVRPTSGGRTFTLDELPESRYKNRV